MKQSAPKENKVTGRVTSMRLYANNAAEEIFLTHIRDGLRDGNLSQIEVRKLNGMEFTLTFNKGTDK